MILGAGRCPTWLSYRFTACLNEQGVWITRWKPRLLGACVYRVHFSDGVVPVLWSLRQIAVVGRKYGYVPLSTRVEPQTSTGTMGNVTRKWVSLKWWLIHLRQAPSYLAHPRSVWWRSCGPGWSGCGLSLLQHPLNLFAHGKWIIPLRTPGSW